MRIVPIDTIQGALATLYRIRDGLLSFDRTIEAPAK
jgi:hypothetical protein